MWKFQCFLHLKHVCYLCVILIPWIDEDQNFIYGQHFTFILSIEDSANLSSFFFFPFREDFLICCWNLSSSDINTPRSLVPVVLFINYIGTILDFRFKLSWVGLFSVHHKFNFSLQKLMLFLSAQSKILSQYFCSIWQSFLLKIL